MSAAAAAAAVAAALAGVDPGGEEARFICPWPGCNRSFAELWRLKVHHRSPPDVRGSGRERGHGCELRHCPKCGTGLEAGRHHVGCAAGPVAPRQAAKRVRNAVRGGGGRVSAGPREMGRGGGHGRGRRGARAWGVVFFSRLRGHHSLPSPARRYSKALVSEPACLALIWAWRRGGVGPPGPRPGPGGGGAPNLSHGGARAGREEDAGPLFPQSEKKQSL